MEAAVEVFADRYGKDAAEVVRGYRNTDFNHLPESV